MTARGVRPDRNDDGDLTSRRSYGADQQSIATTALCSMTLPASIEARTDYTYQYGAMKTATPMKADGTAMTFKLLDRDIDFWTGLPLRSRDSSGLPTEYVFDSSGRLTWIKPTGQAPGGGTVTRGAWTQYCYFKADNESIVEPSVAGYAKVEVISQPNGSSYVCDEDEPPPDALARSSSVYDDLGRLLAEYTRLPSNAWNRRRHLLDGMNRKVWDTEWQAEDTLPLAYKQTWYTNYDYLNRPQTITPPDGSAHAVTVEYTGDRKVSRTAKVATWRNPTRPIVNEDSVIVSTQEFDGLGHLYTLTEPVGGHLQNFTVTATYTWDVGGRLRKVAIPWGGFTQTRTWNYDGRGFLTSEVVPEKGIDGYGLVQYSNYNVFGQAGTTVDGSNILTNTYDVAGRLTEVHDSVHEDPIREYEYSTENSDENLSKGKLLSQVAHNYFDAENDFLVRETMTYGGRDGRISLLATVAGVQTVCGVREFRQEYEWTPLGDVATVSYPRIFNGETPLDVNGPVRLVKNSFDAGFLVGVSNQTTQTQYGTISYHPNTMVSTVQFGTSPASSLSYVKDPNDMARPASISSSTGWATGTYEYDGIGNIKAMRRSALDADTFVYDKASRLKEARFKVSSAWKTESYTHDGWGNIATKTTNGAYLEYHPDLAGSNRIEATYDASGNLTSWSDITYSYYPTNELKTKLSPDWGSIYGYSASGERVARYDDPTGGPDGSTYILRGPDNKPLRAYFEQGCSWVWKKDWIWRDGVALASVDASGTRFLHVDHLGTPRRITNASGALVSTHDYYPFGEQVQSSSDGEVVKFTGHERDFGYASNTDDDLDYMHARYNHPTIARFLSVDPIGGRVRSSQSWNRYAYALNGPLSRFDPDGLTDIHIMVFREVESSKSTIGSFSVLGTAISGATLELPWRDNRTDVSRIPAGTYQGERGHGAILGPLVWVLDVPSRTEVAIHAGIYPKNTKGCILVGSVSGDDRLFDEPRNKLYQLLGYIDAISSSDKEIGEPTTITITITDPPEPKEEDPTRESTDDPFAGTGFCSADGVCH